MKKQNYFVQYKICCLILTLWTTSYTYSQTNGQPMPQDAPISTNAAVSTGPPPPPDAPIDDYLLPLFIAGVLLAGYKFRKEKNTIKK